MKKLVLAVAAFALLSAPQIAQAQAAGDAAPETGIVSISNFKVPMGEDRAKVMEFIEKVVAPQEKANPNLLAFYVLEHYYGADARDVSFVRVYSDFALIEAPCGEPCSAWAEANLPKEGTPEYEEMTGLGEVFMKYYADHSDEIFSTRMSLSKN